MERRAVPARIGPFIATLAVLLLGLVLSLDCRAEDLLQVWRDARAADPVLSIATAQRGLQEEAAVQARSALLPQWQLSAADVRTQREGDRHHQATSSITQALLDLGRLRQWQAERTQVGAEEARLAAAEQALAARVAQAYFGVLSAQAQLATAEANEAAFAEQVRQSQSRFDAGLVAQVDVDQGRTYLALARGSTVLARQVLADARAAVAQIVGSEPGPLRPLAATLPALPPEPASVQAWIDAALAANPALRAEALALAGSEQRIGAARAEHWPTLAAGIDSARAGGPGVVPVDRNRNLTQVALRLNVPLFSGGATASGVRQAQLRRDQQRDTLEAARRSVVRETQAQFTAQQSALALLESTRAAVDAADRALASTRTGQALGTRSNTDLLLAIQNQATARNAHDQARHAYVLARLLLQQAAGGLGETELAVVNDWLLKESR